MLIQEFASGTTASFQVTRVGNNITAALHYDLEGLFDEESGIYLWDGSAAVTIGSASNFVVQQDDRPMSVSLTVPVFSGIRASSYEVYDGYGGANILFEYSLGVRLTAGTLTGSTNTDVFYGSTGVDTLLGQDGTDFLHGGASGDTLNGGNGTDTASYEAAAGTVIISLDASLSRSGEAIGDVLVSIENLDGSQFADSLAGNSGVNTLRGLNGADQLFGRASNDNLFGNDGNDLLFGGLGGDKIYGGYGIDTASYREATSRVQIALDGSHAAFGEAVGDQLNSIESLIGSEFFDRLTGDSDNNFLFGHDGGDNLFGKDGNDLIRGGRGNDVLRGGANADGFYYAARVESGDTVTDFNSADDYFRFVHTEFGNLGRGGLVSSEFQSSTANTAGNSFVRFYYETDTRILRFDPDGDGSESAIIIATLQVGATFNITDIVLV